MLDRFLRRPFPLNRERPLVLGHRGASADAPENTLAAFREAVRQGADGVELDVMRCGTGELVVCHDWWLDRLAGEHLEVSRAPYERLRRVDVGRRFGERFAGERIPTLAEVFEVLPRDAIVNVEIKSRSLRDHGLAALAVREIARDEARHRVVVSSFDPLILARVRLLEHRLPTGILVDAAQSRTLRSRFACASFGSAIHPDKALCTPVNVKAWHRCGLAVAAWTVDDPVDIERCCTAGVDALITNCPGVTFEAVKRFTPVG